MLHEYSSSTFASLPWRIRPMAQGVAATNPLGPPATRSVSESTRDGAPASRLLRLERNGPQPRPGRFLSWRSWPRRLPWAVVVTIRPWEPANPVQELPRCGAAQAG